MNYTVPNRGQISSSGVVDESIFDRYEAPHRPGYYWFVKHGVPNRSEYIFFGSPHSTKSEGMGGRIIPFKCTDGQTIDIQGPWWSNSDSFFKSTGIDITNEYLTFVVISRDRTYEKDHHTMIDVVYKDEAPVLGQYDRWKQVLKDVFSTIPDEKLFVYYESTGGSCHSLEERSKFQ
jgi:hypothetical protein